MKIRWVNAVRDDLQSYAAEIHARLPEVLLQRPLSVTSFGEVDCFVLHRQGQFQAELVKYSSRAKVPLHFHPNVDSIDFCIDGQITEPAVIGNLMVSRMSKRVAIRIPHDMLHGGGATSIGFVALSCQRWNAGEPTHIGLDWAGIATSIVHENLLRK